MTDLFNLDDKLGWADSYMPHKHRIPTKDQACVAKVERITRGH